MENIYDLITKLASESLSKKSKVLMMKKLQCDIDKDKQLTMETASSLLNVLKKFLKKHSELTVPAIKLMNSIAVHTKVNPNYSLLITSLGSLDLSIVNASKDCLKECAMKGVVVDEFLNALQTKGISSENYSIRSNSLELLSNLSQVIDINKHEAQITNILKELLKYKETHELFIDIVKANPLLHKLCKQLSNPLRSTYEDLFKEFTLVEPIGVQYGFVPTYIINDLKEDVNWKLRVGAIEELQELVRREKGKVGSKEFLEYLVTLLVDSNYKVNVIVFEIIKELLLSREQPKESIEVLIPGLMEKLGSNMVKIRQLALKTLRLINKRINPILILNKVKSYLNNPKWHIREETLHFIIISFLENSKAHTFFGRVPYIDLISNIVPLLKDEKSKVAQVAFEACVTIANLSGFNEVFRLLQDLINDQEMFGKLMHRVKTNSIPALDSEGNLVFPYLIAELSAQNSFYLQNSSSPSNDSKARFKSAGNKVVQKNIVKKPKRPQTNKHSVIFPSNSRFKKKML